MDHSLSTLDWLSAGGLVTLIGMSLFLLSRSHKEDLFRSEMRQALLGIEGKGGIMSDVASLLEDIRAVRAEVQGVERSLRAEIDKSRHILRGEFTKAITEAELELGTRMEALEHRVRELERMADRYLKTPPST